MSQKFLQNNSNLSYKKIIDLNILKFNKSSCIAINFS